MTRVLGIDPGTHTGLVDVQDGEFVELLETTFWGAYEYVVAESPNHIDLVVIEISDKTFVWQDNANKGGVGKGRKVGQDVGGARREGELLYDGLARLGYNVKAVPPAGKVDHDVFRAVTGCTVNKTNPHKRDAGMLAWQEYCRLKQMAKVRA